MKEFRCTVNFPDYGSHGPVRGTGTQVKFRIYARDLAGAQARLAEVCRNLPNYGDKKLEEKSGRSPKILPGELAGANTSSDTPAGRKVRSPTSS